MKMKRIIKRHAGLIIAVFGIVAMFPLAALMCQIDVWLGLIGSDGDGPGPLMALQCTILLVCIGIVIEVINPFAEKKT